MKLLLDEMYSPALASALRDAGIETATVRDWAMSGASDADVIAAAAAAGYMVMTENVADFTRLAADYASRGQAHHGVLIALSSRFSRRASGIPAIVAAVTTLAMDPSLDRGGTANRVLYLR